MIMIPQHCLTDLDIEGCTTHAVSLETQTQDFANLFSFGHHQFSLVGWLLYLGWTCSHLALFIQGAKNITRPVQNPSSLGICWSYFLFLFFKLCCARCPTTNNWSLSVTLEIIKNNPNKTPKRIKHVKELYLNLSFNLY